MTAQDTRTPAPSPYAAPDDDELEVDAAEPGTMRPVERSERSNGDDFTAGPLVALPSVLLLLGNTLTVAGATAFNVAGAGGLVGMAAVTGTSAVAAAVLRRAHQNETRRLEAEKANPTAATGQAATAKKTAEAAAKKAVPSARAQRAATASAARAARVGAHRPAPGSRRGVTGSRSLGIPGARAGGAARSGGAGGTRRGGNPLSGLARLGSASRGGSGSRAGAGRTGGRTAATGMGGRPTGRIAGGGRLAGLLGKGAGRSGGTAGRVGAVGSRAGTGTTGRTAGAGSRQGSRFGGAGAAAGRHRTAGSRFGGGSRTAGAGRTAGTTGSRFGRATHAATGSTAGRAGATASKGFAHRAGNAGQRLRNAHGSVRAGLAAARTARGQTPVARAKAARTAAKTQQQQNAQTRSRTAGALARFNGWVARQALAGAVLGGTATTAAGAAGGRWVKWWGQVRKAKWNGTAPPAPPTRRGRAAQKLADEQAERLAAGHAPVSAVVTEPSRTNPAAHPRGTNTMAGFGAYLEKTTSELAAAAAAYDPSGMVEWGGDMRALEAALNNIGAVIDAIHKGANGLPVDAAVKHTIMTVAQTQYAAAAASAEIHSTFRAVHRDELQRVENPRNGESKWDVTSNQA